MGRGNAVRARRRVAVPTGSAGSADVLGVRGGYQRDQRLGGDDATTPSARTAEQTEIALFWLESSPLQWNRIARSLSAGQRLDPWESARLFGLLNMAMADG